MSATLPVVDAASFPLAPYKSLDNATLQARIAAVRAAMGPQLLILGHHYQQDEVIAMSDLRGDSYQLSKMAAESGDCRAIAFCGVHFMAETADILANQPNKLAARGGQRVTVVLPDMAAGCSMADMAAIHQIEDAWDQLSECVNTSDITPVTYINSAASLKAFVGKHGGIAIIPHPFTSLPGSLSMDSVLKALAHPIAKGVLKGIETHNLGTLAFNGTAQKLSVYLPLAFTAQLIIPLTCTARRPSVLISGLRWRPASVTK